MPRQRIITLCASAAFYEHVVKLAAELEKSGYEVLIPLNAQKMRESGDYDVSKVKTWYDNPSDFNKRKQFVDEHIKEVEKADAVLVVNDEKHGVKGYIGPNVMIEIAVAYYLKKPIYVLNSVAKDNSVYEEIMSLGAIIINGNIEGIR